MRKYWIIFTAYFTILLSKIKWVNAMDGIINICLRTKIQMVEEIYNRIVS